MQIIKNNLVESNEISLSFMKNKKECLNVLDDVNFKLNENEIVAILGKSGAGKSSFLRVISGLIPPTLGSVYYKGKQVKRPLTEMTMVFQGFALLPWLTVLGNILFGLDAQGIKRKISEPKAREVIKKIGLEGFENSFISELSGGMKQRVGFARALIVEPEVLLMDEPFSSLDIATARQLREEIVSLWSTNAINTKSMIMVTHNVEEAVLMADRVVIFDSNPGRIGYEIAIDHSHPRCINNKALKDIIEELSNEMYALE
jgi:NitT/TauT family transport system ATP-binding protein